MYPAIVIDNNISIKCNCHRYCYVFIYMFVNRLISMEPLTGNISEDVAKWIPRMIFLFL